MSTRAQEWVMLRVCVTRSWLLWESRKRAKNEEFVERDKDEQDFISKWKENEPKGNFCFLLSI